MKAPDAKIAAAKIVAPVTVRKVEKPPTPAEQRDLNAKRLQLRRRH